jgi:hypothetical protein
MDINVELLMSVLMEHAVHINFTLTAIKFIDKEKSV